MASAIDESAPILNLLVLFCGRDLSHLRLTREHREDKCWEGEMMGQILDQYRYRTHTLPNYELLQIGRYSAFHYRKASDTVYLIQYKLRSMQHCYPSLQYQLPRDKRTSSSQDQKSPRAVFKLVWSIKWPPSYLHQVGGYVDKLRDIIPGEEF